MELQAIELRFSNVVVKQRYGLGPQEVIVLTFLLVLFDIIEILVASLVEFHLFFLI